MGTGAKLGGWEISLLSVLVSSWLMLSCSAQIKGSTGKAAPGTSGGGGSAGTTGSAGSSDSGTSQSTSGTSGSGGKAGGGRDAGICADVHVQATRVKPWILFIIDRSSSMAGSYPGSSNRWQAVYDALMDPTSGVITTLQSMVFFGILLYDVGDTGAGGGLVSLTDALLCLLIPTDPSCAGVTGVVDAGSDGGPIAGCPRLVSVPPALNNAATIDATYAATSPGIGTPTGLALQAGYKMVPDQQQILDRDIGPQFVILATDGQPNGCGSNSPLDLNPEQGVVDQVTAAAAAGIKTYVIAVAVEAAAQAHMEQVAQAGGTGMSAFTPATKDDLVATIKQIVGGAMGCQVKLNGTVKEGQDPCKGKVMLNSQELVCNDSNGWKLADESHIELLGEACDKLMNDPTAMLSADFPCGVFILE